MEKGEQERERVLAIKEARGRILFYFIPCSHFSARFLTDSQRSLSNTHPRSLWLPPLNSSLVSGLSRVPDVCVLGGGANVQSPGICQDHRSRDSNLSGIKGGGGTSWHLSLSCPTPFPPPVPVSEESLD